MLNLPMIRVHKWYYEQVGWFISFNCDDSGKDIDIELCGEEFSDYESPYIYNGDDMDQAMGVLNQYAKSRGFRLGYMRHTYSAVGLLHVDFCPIYLPRNWIFV